MNLKPKNRLRSPDELVGTLAHTDLPPPRTRDADELLLRALRDRDEAAFETLIDRLYLPMIRLAASYVRSREEAEEVVQDTWLAVLRGIDRFEGRSSLKTWICRILVNRARTRATREARSLPFSALDRWSPGERMATIPPTDGGSAADALLARSAEVFPRPEGLPAAPPCPESSLLSDELLQRIETSLATLPVRQKEVATLRDVEGWSAEEVCDALSISPANQRVLLHRARLRIRRDLREYLSDAVPAADRS